MWYIQHLHVYYILIVHSCYNKLALFISSPWYLAMYCTVNFIFILFYHWLDGLPLPPHKLAHAEQLLQHTNHSCAHQYSLSQEKNW